MSGAPAEDGSASTLPAGERLVEAENRPATREDTVNQPVEGWGVGAAIAVLALCIVVPIVAPKLMDAWERRRGRR